MAYLLLNVVTVTRVDVLGSPAMRTWALLALALSLACRGYEPPMQMTRKQRVICMTPSTTEIVAGLGAVDSIVAVDRFSTYPPQVRSLPKVGDFMNPDLETIIAYGSDTLVLADAAQAQVVDKLKDTSLRVLALPMQTLSDVRNAILEIGLALDRGGSAQALLGRLDAELGARRTSANRAARAHGRRPRVLFVVDRQVPGFGAMVASGPGTYLHELLDLAGAENVLVDAPAKYVRVDVDEVIALAPDLILDAVHTADAPRARTDWDRLTSVPAVKSGRVHVLADSAMATPGPRMAEVLGRLQALVWPEQGTTP